MWAAVGAFSLFSFLFFLLICLSQAFHECRKRNHAHGAGVTSCSLSAYAVWSLSSRLPRFGEDLPPQPSWIRLLPSLGVIWPLSWLQMVGNEAESRKGCFCFGKFRSLSPLMGRSWKQRQCSACWIRCSSRSSLLLLVTEGDVCLTANCASSASYTCSLLSAQMSVL